jgi:hypothetical protein
MKGLNIIRDIYRFSMKLRMKHYRECTLCVQSSHLHHLSILIDCNFTNRPTWCKTFLTAAACVSNPMSHTLPNNHLLQGSSLQVKANNSYADVKGMWKVGKYVLIYCRIARLNWKVSSDNKCILDMN